MHDLCEGVCVFTIEGVLTELILIKKVLDLDEVNRRIDSFNYGNAESQNKPQPLYVENCAVGDVNNTGLKSKIRCNQSAAEMLCLTRYLGLMIGDLIPDKDDPFWMLYHVLRELVSLIMAYYYSEADLCRIDELIVRHNEGFVRLLRDLLPKCHFLTHFVRIMRLNGPPAHFWGMTGERKNKELKEVAIATNCNVNMPKTIGIRNQLNMSYLKATFTNAENTVELGAVLEVNVDSEVKKINKHICGKLYSKKFSFIKIFGKKYQAGTVLATGTDGLEPFFGKIINIYELKGLIYIHVKMFEDIEFENYYFAHRVTDASLHSSKDELIWVGGLSEPEPCILTTNSDGTFVAMRYY